MLLTYAIVLGFYRSYAELLRKVAETIKQMPVNTSRIFQWAESFSFYFALKLFFHLKNLSYIKKMCVANFYMNFICGLRKSRKSRA